MSSTTQANAEDRGGKLATIGRRSLRASFEGFCRLVLNHYCGLSATGVSNLPLASCVIVSNHASHLDSVAIMCAAGGGFEDYSMIAADDYFFADAGRAGWLPRLLNLIPAERSASRRAMRELITNCRNAVADKDCRLILFPEGTRAQDGQINKFRNGAALIAAELQIPVVPAYIDGAYEAMPKGSKLVRPRAIQVRFGRQIQPPPFHGIPGLQACRKLTTEIEASVRALGGSTSDDTVG